MKEVILHVKIPEELKEKLIELTYVNENGKKKKVNTLDVIVEFLLRKGLEVYEGRGVEED